MEKFLNPSDTTVTFPGGFTAIVNTMQIGSLFIIQLTKPLANPHGVERIHQLCPGAFRLETCQRWLWVGIIDEDQPVDFKVINELSASFFLGEQAYAQILEVTCGLRSELVGETEVFGQFKEAWAKQEVENTQLFNQLNSCMQKIFEDTKEIRSRFLSDLGSVSYGSVVRKVLQEFGKTESSVLIVGAGKVAQSVAPWLGKFASLTVWNRSLKNLNIIRKVLNQKSNTKAKFIIGSDEEQKAWEEADHVVVCVPFDEALDQHRLKWWKAKKQNGMLIHLGGYLENSSCWKQLDSNQFIPLDSLFEKIKNCDEARNRAAFSARKACAEKAKLRLLGGMIAHGWEDLAAFSEVV